MINLAYIQVAAEVESNMATFYTWANFMEGDGADFRFETTKRGDDRSIDLTIHLEK